MKRRKIRSLSVSEIGMGCMGFVREWGISAVDKAQLEAAHAVTPVGAVQNIYSMVERTSEKYVSPFCVENSGMDYTVLRPGYLRDGDKNDYTLIFKGEQAKGYVSTIPSVVGLAVRLIHDDTLYVRQSVSITRDIFTHN
ncbi:MAG: aldo/keto reductase [Candidatus Cryptobacteroides sp.]